MAQQVVNLEKLAEAQEAPDAAVEAAKLAAKKVAEVANPEKPPKAQEADGGGIADGYRINQGPQGFSVEGFFRRDGSQIFRSAKGFPSEAVARQWIYDQLSEDTSKGRQ